MELTQGYIDSLAPNGSAISNGKSLVTKFIKLHISGDETLLFGECAGSGKKPYACSVDFIDRDNPVARCSCPSRQIPCKHALGLMYAYAAGKDFSIGAVPEDIKLKRGKLAKRAENKDKKLEESKTKEKKPPTKAKLSSARGRIKTQLQGVENAELLVHNILQAGISGIDAAALKALETQAKNLGNYYIGGIQTAFNEVLLNIGRQSGTNYDGTIESLLYLKALLDKARVYLTAKLDGSDGDLLKLETGSAINEQIGHIWTTESLSENGMYIEHAKLVQLAFHSYDDPSRREFVDQGYYFCLNDGNIYVTRNYRPYKALKYIKEDDSCFELIEAPAMYIYPGNLNPRIRYDGYTMHPLSPAHLSAVKSAAKTNFAEVIKAVKNQIMSPLSDKNPLYLLSVTDVVYTESEDGAVNLHITDQNGARQALRDLDGIGMDSVPLIKRMDKSLLIGNAVFVMFFNNSESGILSAKPLSIVTDSGIIRVGSF